MNCNTAIEQPDSPETNQFHLAGLHSDEQQYRQLHPWTWSLTLFGPLILSGAILISLVFFAGLEFTSRLVVNVSLALWLLGRFIILSGTEGGLADFDGSMSSFQLFVLICYLDTITALILAFHIGYLFKVPVIGPRVAALVADGQFILASNPWMRRTTYLGLIAFVGFPLAATGSVGGSVFGRLLGISRASTFACIFVGSLLGNGLMFWFSDVLGNFVDKDHALIRFGGILLILVFVIILERRYQKLRKRYLQNHLQAPMLSGNPL
jgi:uncharacterized membrane protein